MTNPPIPPPSPKPKSIDNLLTRRKLILAGSAVAIVFVSAAGLLVMQHGSDQRHTQDAALHSDYVPRESPPAAYQAIETRTDANGNVSTTAAPAAASGSTGSMQRVWLGDPGVGMQNAMSLNIPFGWQFQGEVVRNVPCSPGDAFPQLKAASPDGAYSLTVMTPFFTTSMPSSYDLRSCGVMAQPTSAANILSHYVVPALRRGAQVSAPEPVPEAEEFLRTGNQSGNGMTQTADVARVRVSYSQNGQSFEEYIVGFTLVLRRQGTVAATSSTAVAIYKAPGGKLDAFYKQAAMTMELAPNPQWQQRNAQLAQQQAQQMQQQGERQRQAIQQEGQDGGAAGRAMLANTRNQIQATGQASMDNAARNEAARHTGAVGTMDYVGDRGTAVYYFCSANGGRTTNNNPNPPGPGWYSCN